MHRHIDTPLQPSAHTHPAAAYFLLATRVGGASLYLARASSTDDDSFGAFAREAESIMEEDSAKVRRHGKSERERARERDV